MRTIFLPSDFRFLFSCHSHSLNSAIIYCVTHWKNKEAENCIIIWLKSMWNSLTDSKKKKIHFRFHSFHIFTRWNEEISKILLFSLWLDLDYRFHSWLKVRYSVAVSEHLRCFECASSTYSDMRESFSRKTNMQRPQHPVSMSKLSIRRRW